MEEAPFYWLFERGGTILFIWSKTMLAVGWSFVLWSMLNKVTWSSRLDRVTLLVWPA